MLACACLHRGVEQAKKGPEGPSFIAPSHPSRCTWRFLRPLVTQPELPDQKLNSQTAKSAPKNENKVERNATRICKCVRECGDVCSATMAFFLKGFRRDPRASRSAPRAGLVPARFLCSFMGMCVLVATFSVSSPLCPRRGARGGGTGCFLEGLHVSFNNPGPMLSKSEGQSNFHGFREEGVSALVSPAEATSRKDREPRYPPTLRAPRATPAVHHRPRALPRRREVPCEPPPRGLFGELCVCSRVFVPSL